MGVETLAIAAIATSVIGAGVSAYGQYQQGQAQRQQAQYQSAVADLNAQTARRNSSLASQNAAYVEAGAAKQIDERARRIRAVQGAQRAALAANGLLLDSGTAADLTGDTARLGNLAIGEIRENGGRQAAGYRIAGMNAEAEAQAATLRGQAYAAAGESASTAGWLSAGTSLLGGATSTFDRWSDMRRTGVPLATPPVVT